MLKIAANHRTDAARQWHGTTDIDQQPLADAKQHQPDRIAEANDDHRQLRDCLGRLPEEFADVMRLWMHGESYRSIADDLQIPIDTVGSRMHRAKVKLAECLEGRPR